jgi:GT2 family glycosyltransferase
MLAKEFPWVRFVQSDTNLGFARANNLGASYATGESICFLNPDTKLLNSALEKMHEVVRTADRPGAVGCRLFNSDGSVQTSCIQSFPTLANQALDSEWIRRFSPRSELWGMSALYQNGSETLPVQVISGACLTMDRTVFEALGRFSEDYFMYAEDLDLCYKAAMQGCTNYYVPDGSVIHYGGGSSSQRVERAFPSVQMRESVLRFLRKFRGASYAERYRRLMGWSARVRIGMLSLTGSDSRGSLEKWRAILVWSKEAK